jgi:membrane-associated phospholipid phosphatase
MHYPADVLGGFILGPTFVYCTVSAARIATRLLESPSPRADEHVTV